MSFFLCEIRYCLEKKNKKTKNFFLSARNKFALLIANEEYDKNPLRTPVNDMNSLASELADLGFRCMMCKNVRKSEFMSILKLFSTFLQAGDYG